jgi:S-ribosylhomocysteine lyase LuxS involved in autoinducer biosynthesis
VVFNLHGICDMTTGLLTGLFLVYIGTEKTATTTSCFDCCLPGSAEEKDTELVPGQNNVDIGKGVLFRL